MRIPSRLVLFTVCAAACGGSSNSGVDSSGGPGDTGAPDAMVDIGFTKPTMPLEANTAGASSGTFTDAGSADLSCLGSADPDAATTTAVALTVHVTDFQTGSVVTGAAVTAFPGVAVGSAFGAASTSNGSGDAVVNLPVGTKRFGVKMTQSGSLDSLVFNNEVDPATAAQTTTLGLVSTSTASILPQAVGLTRTPGTGILAGRVRDCQGRTISNFIAVISSTKGTATALPGEDTFYFILSPSLPNSHAHQDASNQDGLFVSLQVPPTATSFVQIWGYATAADLAADKLTLVAQEAMPVIGDTVIQLSLSPVFQ